MGTDVWQERWKTYLKQLNEEENQGKDLSGDF